MTQPPFDPSKPPPPYPGGARAGGMSAGKTVAIVMAVVLGASALGVIVFAGACLGLLYLMGA